MKKMDLVLTAVAMVAAVAADNKKTTKKVASYSRSLKLGDHTLKIEKVIDKGVILSITGRENGFKTLFVLNPEQITKIKEYVIDNHVHRSEVISMDIKNVQIKATELTSVDYERDMTYKYYNTSNGAIKITHHGELVVIMLYDKYNRREYRTVHFRINDVMSTAPAFFRGIDRKAGEFDMKHGW